MKYPSTNIALSVVHWDTKPPTVIPPVPTDVLSTSSNLSDRETICLSKTDSFGYQNVSSILRLLICLLTHSEWSNF